MNENKLYQGICTAKIELVLDYIENQGDVNNLYIEPLKEEDLKRKFINPLSLLAYHKNKEKSQNEDKQNRYLNIADILLSHGCDPYIVNKYSLPYNVYGYDALQLSCLKNDNKLVKTILKYNPAGINNKDNYGNDLISYILMGFPYSNKKNHNKIPPILNRVYNAMDNYDLNSAILTDNLSREYSIPEYAFKTFNSSSLEEWLKFFLNKGMDVNKKLKNGDTYLHFFAKNNYHHLIKLIIKLNPENDFHILNNEGKHFIDMFNNIKHKNLFKEIMIEKEKKEILEGISGDNHFSLNMNKKRI